MAQIYITDETKSKLDLLSDKEKRSLTGEVEFLCDMRIKELSAPSNENPQSVKSDNNKNDN